MTARQLQNRIDRLNKSYLEFSRKHHAAKAASVRELEPICDHRVTEEYNWEHDNGYGRQSACVGWICVHCRARKPYQTMGRWIPAKEYRG